MGSEFILEARDLWHVYDGGLAAVRGVSLGIRPGEFVAFVGANGSGKTTLIKHFNGLHKPTRGSMRVVLPPARVILGETRKSSGLPIACNVR